MKLVIKRTRNKNEKKQIIPVCHKFKSKTKDLGCGKTETKFEKKKHIITIKAPPYAFECDTCKSPCATIVEQGKNEKPLYDCPKCQESKSGKSRSRRV